jgi:hypothetical protein
VGIGVGNKWTQGGKLVVVSQPLCFNLRIDNGLISVLLPVFFCDDNNDALKSHPSSSYSLP